MLLMARERDCASCAEAAAYRGGAVIPAVRLCGVVSVLQSSCVHCNGLIYVFGWRDSLGVGRGVSVLAQHARAPLI